MCGRWLVGEDTFFYDDLSVGCVDEVVGLDSHEDGGVRV